jgi:hypothetical protein
MVTRYRARPDRASGAIRYRLTARRAHFGGSRAITDPVRSRSAADQVITIEMVRAPKRHDDN